MTRNPFAACTALRAPDGTLFQVLDAARFQPAFLTALGDFEHPTLPPGGALLKQARQRFIARAPAPGGSVVFKVFPLKNPISRLKFRKYACREFANLQTAQERGAPVPLPIAYFEKRRFGLVVACGLVMEDLRGWQDLKQIAGLPGESALTAAHRASAVLADLDRRGCLHVDARDENILVSPDGAHRVIDWQYASFHAPNAPWLLEHLAAYYIRKSDAADQTGLNLDWLPKLALFAANPDGFLGRVAALLREKPSTRARLAKRPARKT